MRKKNILIELPRSEGKGGEGEMKKFLALILVLNFVILLGSCSEGGSMSNTNPKNLYAIITLPNGDVVEGKVKEYHRYDEGCIEIHIGKNVYYVHSARVALLETPQNDEVRR